MIGLVTQEARARAEKARQEREGLIGHQIAGDRAAEPMTDAHAVAEGAAGHHLAHTSDAGCTPGIEREAIAHDVAEDRADDGYQEAELSAHVDGQGDGFSKAVREVTEGPGQPMVPGQLGPEHLYRPYLSAGHGAQSPGNAVTSDGMPGAQGHHADFTASRGVAAALDPMNLGLACPPLGSAR